MLASDFLLIFFYHYECPMFVSDCQNSNVKVSIVRRLTLHIRWESNWP